MSKRNCSTIDIDTRPIPVKFFAVREGLCSKCFVYFDQIEIVYLEACTLKETVNGTGRRSKDEAGSDRKPLP